MHVKQILCYTGLQAACCFFPAHSSKSPLCFTDNRHPITLLTAIKLRLGVLDGKEIDFYFEMPGLNIGQGNASPKADT